jgi:VCBS repeat-containing protein
LVASDTNGVADIYLHDRTAGITTLVSATATEVGNASSWDVALSGDGTYVLFASDATNLVAGDSNAVGDVFLYHTTDGSLTRVNLTNSGTQADAACFDLAVSLDNTMLAFTSPATNAVAGDTNVSKDVFVKVFP